MDKLENRDFPLKLKLFISIIAVIFLLLHLTYPNLGIDAISYALILLLLFPWIFEYIQKISFPGGGGIERATFTKPSKEEIKTKKKEDAKEALEVEKKEITETLGREKKEESISEKILKLSTDEFVTKIPEIQRETLYRIYDLFFTPHSSFSSDVKVTAGFGSYILDGILYLPGFGDVVVEIKIFKKPTFDFNKILTNIKPQIEFVRREMPTAKKYLLVIVSTFSKNQQRRDLVDSFMQFKHKFGYGFLDVLMFDFDELYIDI